MNKDQFVRYKALDRCFRVNPPCYDKEGLLEACCKAIQHFHCDPDRKVKLRTIELDLQELKSRYGIKLCENIRLGRKKLYQYEDTSFSLMKKLLADGELEQMLLQNVLETLELYEDVPQYRWLKLFLQQQMNGKRAEDTQAIEFQNNPDLLGMEHFDTLLDSILRHQTLSLEYQKYHGVPKTYQVHPYLLKQFNDRWFLIARTEGYPNISNYAIDRIKKISPSSIPYQSAGIDLKEYFEEVVGVTRDERKPIEEVIIRITRSRYPYLETKPLHASQTPLRAQWDDENCVIRLKVQISNELEAKILSLGSDAEVLAPECLRNAIKQKIELLFNKYSNSANELRR